MAIADETWEFICLGKDITNLKNTMYYSEVLTNPKIFWLKTFGTDVFSIDNYNYN